MANKSLKTKFIIITCLITLITMSIVSAVSYITSLGIVESELNQKIDATVLKNASSIDSWFNEQTMFVDNMAEDITFNGNYDTEYLAKYLRLKLAQQEDQVLDYYIGFDDGHFLSGSYWIPPHDYDHRTKKWYTNAVEKNGLILSTPHVDAIADRMVITIAEPLYNEGTLVGVLAADITVNYLVQLAKLAGQDTSGYAFLLDQEGNFLVTPALEWQPSPDGLKDAYQVMNGGFTTLLNDTYPDSINTVQLLDYDGDNKYFFTTRVESSNWIFGKVIPKYEYVMPLNRLLISFVIILILSLIAGSLIILGVINGLISPLNQLRAAVLKFAQKDFSVRSPVYSEDEIGDLSKSFNDMADTIQEYNGKLENMVQERTRELQEKSLSIVESINYSKRIQEAILPDLLKYKGIAYDDHFVIWKPRDIVGGDFYWSKQVGDAVFIVMADCTGHGVPGALMTMTVNVILNHIVSVGETLNPAAILQKLNRNLRETLRQDVPDAMTNDGVDIGICMLMPNRNEMIYAGSRISLFACQGDEIIMIKGDRQSLGYKRSRVDYEYTDHHLALDNQIFYLTTDGLIDQNGEENQKSFGVTRLKTTLLEIKDFPLDRQKEFLLQILNKYMGSESQRDDITILGFRI